MARKKAKKSYGRRRVSGVGKGLNLTNILGIVGGAAASGFLSKVQFVGKQSATIQGAIKIAIGGFVIPKFARGNAILQAAGTGMIAAGGLQLLGPKETGGLGILSGTDDEMILDLRSMSGADDMEQPDVINGMDSNIDVVNGFEQGMDDEDLSGDNEF